MRLVAAETLAFLPGSIAILSGVRPVFRDVWFKNAQSSDIGFGSSCVPVSA
jgi:hypothetical protein